MLTAEEYFFSAILIAGVWVWWDALVYVGAYSLGWMVGRACRPIKQRNKVRK